jgi:hypothetical protein
LAKSPNKTQMALKTALLDSSKIEHGLHLWRGVSSSTVGATGGVNDPIKALIGIDGDLN